jgi:small subunit ribosomal protein S9
MAKTKETKKTEEKEKKTAAKPAARKPRLAVKKVQAATIPAKKTIMTVKEREESEVAGRKKTDKYYEAVGRRKTAIARVRLYTRGEKIFTVNDKPLEKYFQGLEFKNIIEAPLVKMNCTDRFRVSARVLGGGINAQAEALRHGISRALVMFNADFKKRLKKSGYLTRDPRMKERKKPGLKKARRAPQWAKR